MGTQRSGFHVLLFPWLAHGHISPFLELARKLAERNFRIHLCSTPINLSSVKDKIGEKYSSCIQLQELHLPHLPELPPHYHTTNGLPPHLMNTLKDAFDMSSPSFENIVETLKPDLLIYDFNQPWAVEIALSRNIPAVQFITGGAAFVSFCHHMVKKGGENFPFPEINLGGHEILKMQGSANSAEDNSKDHDRFIRALELSSNIILIKSFREIEGKYMDYFSLLTEKKVVTVGPLVQDQDVKLMMGMNPNSVQCKEEEEDEQKKILQWLDRKTESSVVFVSFGSECFLSKEDMEEIAHGLELSKVNFIWVIRFPVGEKISIKEALPEGFFERVGEKGFVVEDWAPQAKILEHSSTGGFVSHCGWNSVMESMKLGVPIIAMPMHVDQPFNARVVKAVGVGVEVPRDDKGKLGREDIAQVIRKVVLENSGDGVRRKARELSEKIGAKGEEDIDGAVEELVQLCSKTN